jgi:hypothetical protein
MTPTPQTLTDNERLVADLVRELLRAVAILGARHGAVALFLEEFEDVGGTRFLPDRRVRAVIDECNGLCDQAREVLEAVADMTKG